MSVKITILGSGSSGNSYLIELKESVFLIEAGIAFQNIKIALNFNISKLKFVISLHQHFDHSKYIKEYMKFGIPVYMNKETAKVHSIDNNPFCNIFENLKTFNIGDFKLHLFPLHHDVVCSGLYISHNELGNLVYISDSFYCKYTFPNINYFLIEANYSEEILEKNIQKGLNVSHARRVLQSHFEIKQTIETLKANDLSHVKAIVLLHLSDGNSNANQFKNMVQEQTGKLCYIAEKNLIIDI